MPDTVRDVLHDAYAEFNQVGIGEAMPASLAAFGLRRFNMLVDQWNAIRPAIWNEEFLEFTLVPDLAPHTIGPTGATFTVDSRPVSLEGASVILTDQDPAVKVPLILRDDEWWANQPVPTLAANLSTDLFYSPTYPNGSLYFWPVPQIAYGVQLVTRGLLSSATLDTVLSYPPGYRAALTYRMAMWLAGPIGQPVTADLEVKARMAEAAIFSNNVQPPRQRTRDAGMPGAGSGRGGWNYITNTPTAWPEGR